LRHPNLDHRVSTGFAYDGLVTAMKDKPEQATITKLRDLSRQLDVARRSQRAATTELTKTKRGSAPRQSRKTPPR
jgi:hypothetical protein